MPESVDDLELWSRNKQMVASNRLDLTDNHLVRVDSNTEGRRNGDDEDEQTLPL
jgi:hypothetical protein